MKKLMMSIALSAMLVFSATGCQATETTTNENSSEVATTSESTVAETTSEEQSDAEDTSVSEDATEESESSEMASSSEDTMVSEDATEESESSEMASSSEDTMVSEDAQLFTEESFKTFVEENSDHTYIIFNTAVFDVTELEVKTDAEGNDLESGKDYTDNLSSETLMSIATATVVGAIQE